MRTIIFLSILILGACTSSIKDSSVFIKGFVYDEDGIPIEGVGVVFSGMEINTNEDGCFYFGGLLSLDNIELSVKSSGYSDYFISTVFENVLLSITLARSGSTLRSQHSGVTVNENWASSNRGCST